MFLRLTYLNFSPESLEQAKQVYEDEVAPGIRKQKGNVEASFLVPADGNDEFISSSLWRDESDLKAFENGNEYVELLGKIKQFVTKPPQQKYYRVTK